MDLNSTEDLALIVAHPDDELFLFGGLIAAGKWNSVSVFCVTDGGGQFYKTSAYSPELSKEREGLLTKLADDKHWNLTLLSHPDKGVNNLLNEAKLMADLNALKEALAKHTIVTHGILGEYLHPHHFQVARCVNQVFPQTFHFHPFKNASFRFNISEDQRGEIQKQLSAYYPKQAEDSLVHAVPYELGFSKFDNQDIAALQEAYLSSSSIDKSLIKKLFGEIMPLSNHPNLYVNQSNWLQETIGEQPWPKISIIIPCSSKGQLIINTIKALPNKPTVEIIVILSNANAETKDLLLSLKAERTSLRILEDEKQSPSTARNLGIKHASAELLILLDADILVPTGFVENRLKLHQQNSKDLLLYSIVDNYDVGEAGDYREDLLMESGTPGIAEINSSHKWLHANTASVSFYKSNLISEQLYFDEAFEGWGLEDQEWFLRLAQSYRLSVDLHQKVLHQPHPRSLTHALESYRMNGRKFIKKHPQKIVECLVIFGCRYAEQAFEMLSELEKEHGKAYQITQPKSDSDLYGMFTDIAPGTIQELSINPRFFEQLPPKLIDTFQREMARITGQYKPKALHSSSAAESQAWNELTSDFTFSAL